MNDPISELVDRWRVAVSAAHKSHLMIARRVAGQDRLLGLGVVILTAVSGTKAFATLNGTSFKIQFLLGLLSAMGGVLSSVALAK
jgi:hypothetical protein